MRGLGTFLIVIGIVGGLVSVFAIDTSIKVRGASVSLGAYLPREVTNLHLQQIQMLAFIASAVSILAGSIFLAAGTIAEKMSGPADAAPIAANDAERSAFIFWIVSGTIVATVILVLLASLYGRSSSAGYSSSAADQNQAAADALNELNRLDEQVRSFERASGR